MKRKMLPFLILLSASLTGCAPVMRLLGLAQTDRPPVVLTKITPVERPLAVDPLCPKDQKPKAPPKPSTGNTPENVAVPFLAERLDYGEACEAKNEELAEILRPSTEANKTEPKQLEGNP